MEPTESICNTLLVYMDDPSGMWICEHSPEPGYIASGKTKDEAVLHFWMGFSLTLWEQWKELGEIKMPPLLSESQLAGNRTKGSCPK